MRRVVASFLMVAASLGGPSMCAAREPNDVQFRLEAGVCAIASPRRYNDVVELHGAPEIVSVGASLTPRRFASASLDFGFFNLGRGTLSDFRPPNTVTTVESSSLLTALVGLELRRPTADRRGPYLTTAIGWGRAFLGAAEVGSLTDPVAIRYPGTRLTGPVVSCGAGVRTPKVLDGPNIQLDVRIVSLLSSGRSVSLIPVTIGFLF